MDPEIERLDPEQHARELAEKAEQLRRQAEEQSDRDRRANEELDRALEAPLTTLRRIAQR